jgi:hypothetical protein
MTRRTASFGHTARREPWLPFKRGKGSPDPTSSRLFKPINSKALATDVTFDEHLSL